MSGGPTIDLITNKVVGVNVYNSSQENNANVSLLIGFDAQFGIEE
jgi:hypothetical protein